MSWKTRKQSCVALSTAESEYVSLASAVQEAVWLRQLMTDLKCTPRGATVINEDNQSAICIAKNPQFRNRTKHISIKYHFVRDQIEAETVELVYCRSENMIADMLTKGLTKDKLDKLIRMSDFKGVE